MKDEDVKELLRNNFEDFFIQCFHHTHPDTELNWDPYLEYICYRYQSLSKGSRVVFNQPPRTLKSWTAKFYAAWCLGRKPSTDVMIITNTQRLSEEFSYDIRKILRAKWYAKIFPRLILEKDRSAVGFFKTTRGGSVFAGSVETSLAGFGADLIILDDPNKISDASRSERLQEVNEKFDGEIYSRLNNRKRGVIVVVQHRLNKDDLSGHVIRQGFKSFPLPLVATRNKAYKLSNNKIWHRKKGSILVPSSYSKKDVEKEKKKLNPPYFWFHQQGVGKINEQQLKIADFRLEFNPVFRGPTVISIDTASRDGESSSYNVIQVWRETHETLHLAHQFRERCSFSALETEARKLIKKMRPAAVLIEHAANGAPLLSRLKKTLKKFNLKAVEPTESKTERLNRHRSSIRHGLISIQGDAEWAPEYIAEFVLFPAEYTDQIDATTQYLDFFEKNTNLPAPPDRGTGAVVYANGSPNSPNSPPVQRPPISAALALGSHLRRRF